MESVLFMNFTLFLNSRGRVPQLTRFVEIVEKTTINLSSTELIITGDEDDQDTVEFLNSLSSRRTLIFNPIIGPRPKSLCGSYNNMTNKAEGRYLFVMNDDAEILTTGWDDIALKKIQQFQKDNNIKDDIVFGVTSDTSIDKAHTKEYPSFPIISKQAVNVLGFFMHDNFVGLGGDSAVFRIYKESQRVVDMKEIVVDHIYHNTIYRVMAPDKTAAEMRENTAVNLVDPFSFDVSDDTKKLQDFITKSNQ